MDNVPEEIMEIWKPVAGYEGVYSVSSLGRIRRDGFGGRNVVIGRILKSSADHCGYHRISLSFNGKGRVFKVHKIVASAFIGVRPEGYQINHIDGNKNNNGVNNLEYVTPSDNVKHAFRSGLNNTAGEKNNFSKLTDREVSKIRDLYNSGGHTNKKLSSMFGVCEVSISNITSNRAWKHLLNTSA